MNAASSTELPSQRVGLVGFGIMGAAIVPRLLAAGYRVVVFDASEEAMARAIGLGCTSVN